MKKDFIWPIAMLALVLPSIVFTAYRKWAPGVDEKVLRIRELELLLEKEQREKAEYKGQAERLAAIKAKITALEDPPMDRYWETNAVNVGVRWANTLSQGRTQLNLPYGANYTNHSVVTLGVIDWLRGTSPLTNVYMYHWNQ